MNTPDLTTINPRCIPILNEGSIITARHQGRVLALRLGFGVGDVTLVASVISELARNILLYAGQGEITLETVESDGDEGLSIVARDHGPGIGDIRRAMEDGYSTSGRLGLGLSGARRLMDEFAIASRLGQGTEIRGIKWRR
jgi:serine/threonine-protein kinase RsbT